MFFIWYNTIILTSSCNTRSRGLKALSIDTPPTQPENGPAVWPKHVAEL
jgi:hypothetical protein